MRRYNCKITGIILSLTFILGVNAGWAQESVAPDSVPVPETPADSQKLSSEVKGNAIALSVAPDSVPVPEAPADTQGLSSEARNDAVVLSVVQKHRALFNYYYKRAWKYNQQAKGSIKIRVTIQVDGQVKEVEVLSDSVKIRSLTRFILRHAKKWEFNKAESGGSVVDLVFPFAPA